MIQQFALPSLARSSPLSMNLDSDEAMNKGLAKGVENFNSMVAMMMAYDKLKASLTTAESKAVKMQAKIDELENDSKSQNASMKQLEIHSQQTDKNLTTARNELRKVQTTLKRSETNFLKSERAKGRLEEELLSMQQRLGEMEAKAVDLELVNTFYTQEVIPYTPVKPIARGGTHISSPNTNARFQIRWTSSKGSTPRACIV